MLFCARETGKFLALKHCQSGLHRQSLQMEGAQTEIRAADEARNAVLYESAKATVAWP